MILESLELNNIRSYADHSIEFPRGTVLFWGDIGSGKSTILMGIEFALFGLGSLDASSLLNRSSNKGGVTLEFSLDGSRYKVHRELKRKKNGTIMQDSKSTFMEVDGTRHALSPTELKQMVIKTLKFREVPGAKASSRIYRYAVYIPQEEMKAVLSDPLKRLESIRRAFGIEDYGRAAENAGEEARLLRQEAARLEGRFADMEDAGQAAKEEEIRVAGLRADLEEHEAGLDEARILLEAATAEMKRTREEIVRIEGLQEDLVGEKSSHAGMVSEVKALAEVIDGHEKAVKEAESKIARHAGEVEPRATLDTIESSLSRHKVIELRLAKLDTEKSLLEKAADDLEGSLGDERDAEKLRRAAAGAHDEAARLWEEAEAVRTEHSVVHDRMTSDKSEMRGIRKDEKRLDSMKDRCPYCKNRITKEHVKQMKAEEEEKIGEIEARLKSDEEKLGELASSISRLEAECDGCKEEGARLEGQAEMAIKYAEAISMMGVMRSEMDGLAKEAQGLSPVSELEDEKRRIIEYEGLASALADAKKDRAEHKKDLADAQSRAAALERKIKTASKGITKAEKELEIHAGIKDERDNLEEKRSAARADISGYEKAAEATRDALKVSQKTLDGHKTALKEAEKHRAEHLRVSSRAGWLADYYVEALISVEKEAMRRIRGAMNDSFVELYSLLVEDPSKEAYINTEFAPMVLQDGLEHDVAYLSGGERTSVGLAYRLAINMLMRRETESLRSGLLILDEPTDGFSTVQMSRLRSILEHLESEQVIIVSHEEMMKSHADRTFVVTKDEGHSRVVPA